MKVQLQKNQIVLLDQVLFSGTSFATTVLVARMLDIDGFGLWSAYILGLYLVLSALSAFVIQPFQVILASQQDAPAYRHFTFWLEGAAIFLCVGFAVLAALLFDLKLPVSLYFFAAGFLFHDYGRRFLLAIDRVSETLWLDLLVSVGVVTALGAFWYGAYAGLESLMSLLAWAYFPSFLFFVFMTRPLPVRRVDLVKWLNLHLREGKWLFLTAVSQWWSSNLLVVSAGLFLGAQALAALRLSQSLMGVMNVLLQTFENYLLPQVSQRLSSDIQDGFDFLIQSARKAGILFLPLLAAIGMFASPILMLAGGEDYASFGFVLRGVSLLYVLVYFSQPIRLLIRGLLLNNHFFYGYLFSLGFALAFSQYLVSSFGLNGVIYGLAISQLIMMAYWTLVLKKRQIYLWKSFISF